MKRNQNGQVGWVILVLVLIVALPIGLWAAGVFTSDIHGRGEQIKQINRASNRTFAQEQFVQLLNDIKGYDDQIGVQEDALAAHAAQDGEHDRLAQVVAGLKSQCLSVRAQYDAETQKITKRKFLDAGLPYTIDTYEPQSQVDCRKDAA